MSFLTGLKLFLQYLPEFVKLLKMIGRMTENGISEYQIRKDFKEIERIFDRGNSLSRQERAQRLSDLFGNKS